MNLNYFNDLILDYDLLLPNEDGSPPVNGNLSEENYPEEYRHLLEPVPQLGDK